MAVFTLKAILDMVSGIVPALQVHLRSGKAGTTLTDIDLDKLLAMKDPVVACRHVQELEALSRSVKEFAQRNSITWTVPTLSHTVDKNLRMRLAVNAIGYLITFVLLQARDRVERVANAEHAALRHQKGTKPLP